MDIETDIRVWKALVAVRAWLKSDLLVELNSQSEKIDFKTLAHAYKIVDQYQFELDTSFYRACKEALEHLSQDLSDLGSFEARYQSLGPSDDMQNADLIAVADSAYKNLVAYYESRLHTIKEIMEQNSSGASHSPFPSLEYVGGGIRINSPDNQQVNKVVNIGEGASISAPITIADAIEGSFNTLAEATVDDEIEQLLRQLLVEVNEVNKQVSQEMADGAEAMVRDTQSLVNEATSSSPRRRWYEVSLEGLTQAAENIGEIAEPVLRIVKRLIPLLLA